MKKILVENIEDGMVLARDVFGSSGSALLNKGTKLTVNMGRRLKNWGVPFVAVEGEEENEWKEKPTVEISADAVQKQLEEKFADVIDDLIMKKILDAVVAVKTKSNS